MSEADEGAGVGAVAADGNAGAIADGDRGAVAEAAAPSGDAGNALGQLQSQMAELNRRHEAVLTNMAQSRSVVYIPREKPITPFSGEVGKDVNTVDEFIEEVERGMRARALRGEDQVDFILSLLKGSALEEIKLRMRGGSKQPGDIFSYLRDAFREKRTVPQLLNAFYARRQLEGEDLKDYSHAISQILNSALLQSPSAVHDVASTLRDQFIEGVRDSGLRRELRRLVREKPSSTLIDVREEAILWTLEDRPRSSSVAKSRQLTSCDVDGQPAKASPTNAEADLATTLTEVVKLIAQQGKAISELTGAIRGLTLQNTNPGGAWRGGRPRNKPRYTEDGQPICLRCEGIGHMAKQCTVMPRTGEQTVTTSAAPGNETPPLP